jgi:hypothetical protein
MPWIGFDNAFVCVFRTKVILLLLEDMSDLEPDVSMSKRAWRVAKDTIKASQRVLEFALLLIYDA